MMEHVEVLLCLVQGHRQWWADADHLARQGSEQVNTAALLVTSITALDHPVGNISCRQIANVRTLDAPNTSLAPHERDHTGLLESNQLLLDQRRQGQSLLKYRLILESVQCGQYRGRGHWVGAPGIGGLAKTE